MEDLRATADLLNMVFAHDPPMGVNHLAWYYHQNPTGRAAVGQAHDEGRLVGNYALVPLRFRSATGPAIVLGLGGDLSVHPAARGSGAYRRTVEDSYRVGTEAGLDGILGVANAESAPRMVKTMGWRMLPLLTSRLLVATPGRHGFAAHPVNRSLLDSNTIQQMLPQEVPVSANGHGATWDSDHLRWRLGRPGADYVVHERDDVLLVSTTTTVRRLRVAVLLKVLPRQVQTDPIPSGPLAAALATHHCTPLVLHWGANPSVRFLRISIPHRLQPSPLALVVHPFADNGVPRFDPGALSITGFEFLDFDAY